MDKNKLDPSIMEFLDDRARVVNIVGNYTSFEDKKEFLEEALYSFIDDGNSYTVDDVYEDFVKWYDNPDDACVAPLDIFEKGCYSWASQEDEKGAFKVYVIDIW